VRGDADRLLDMIEMCDLLLTHASDPVALRDDPVVQAAAQRWIEVLGEAASHVSDELREDHPDVPWRKIIGTRIILAHGYFRVEQGIIDAIVMDEVPLLRQRLATALEGETS
jgi:uncharacterized protein with HEPN domain